jgi:hypothetical protein
MVETTEDKKELVVPTSEERIANLEKTNALILEALGKLSAPPTQQIAPQQKMDIMAMLPLLQNLGGGEKENTMDSFFNDLGKRMFFNMVDKTLPTRREIREGFK